MSLLTAGCLHKIKTLHPYLGLALKDRKEATISKTRGLSIFVVIEIACLLVINEVKIFIGKLGNLLGLLGDFQLACCSSKAGKINLNWAVCLRVVVSDDICCPFVIGCGCGNRVTLCRRLASCTWIDNPIKSCEKCCFSFILEIQKFCV